MTRRNILSFAILTCAVLCASANSAAQNVKAPFTLKLSAKTYEFRVGSEVSILITQTNISNHSIKCSGTYLYGVDFSYFYDVKDENGNQAEKIDHPQSDMAFGDVFQCNQWAGKTVTRYSAISNIFKFDRAGKYVIQVSRHASDDPDTTDETKVFSNTITITITG